MQAIDVHTAVLFRLFNSFSLDFSFVLFPDFIGNRNYPQPSSKESDKVCFGQLTRSKCFICQLLRFLCGLRKFKEKKEQQVRQLKIERRQQTQQIRQKSLLKVSEHRHAQISRQLCYQFRTTPLTIRQNWALFK